MWTSLTPKLIRCLSLAGLFGLASSATVTASPQPVSDSHPVAIPSGLDVHPEIAEALVRGQDLAFSRRYEEALELFVALEQDHPGSPVGAIGQMLVHQAVMLENDDLSRASEFERASKAARERVRHNQRSRGNESWDALVAGAYHGLRGLHALRERRLVASARAGLDAIGRLRVARKGEDHLRDVDLGRGAYLYFRSRIAREAKWLPFGERAAEGIELIERSRDEGTFTSPIARLALVFVLLEEQRIEESLAAGEELTALYPDNVLVRVQRVRALMRQRRFGDALRELDRIETIDTENRLASYYRGFAELQRGHDLSRAEVALHRFVERAPSVRWESEGLERLGDVHFKRGDRTRALQYWKQARDRHPGNKSLRRKLADRAPSGARTSLRDSDLAGVDPVIG